MKYLLLLLGITVTFWCSAQQIVSGEYFFDTDPGYGNAKAFSLNAGVEVDFSQNISVEHLNDGYHTFYYRLKTTDGVWGQTASKSVYKVVTPKIAQLYYQIDTDDAKTVNITPKAEALEYTLNERIAELETGEHQIKFWVVNDLGIQSDSWIENFSKTANSVYSDNSTVELKVYPNPTTDFIIIDSDHELLSTAIYSISGKLIWETQSGLNRINLNKLRTGTYLITVKTNKGLAIKTIVKR